MRFGWGLPLMAGACLFACGGDDDDNQPLTSNPDAGILDSSVQNDGGAGAPKTVTINTHARRTSLAPTGPISATLAARLEDDGTTWSVLAPKDTGVYELTTTTGRFTAAFVCTDDKGNVDVLIEDRAASTASYDVTLETCMLPTSKVYDLTGTFANVPATSDWLDFAYALDTRGSVLPPTGTSADYELPNIQAGTWDLVYGLREDDGEPLLRMYIARGQKVAANVVLDADLSTAGFEPGANTLTVNGMGTDDLLASTIEYSVGNEQIGFPVGPPSNLVELKKHSAEYATVPAAKQAASDLYVVSLSAGGEGASAFTGFTGTFHTAVDTTLTLPAAVPSLTTTIASSAPYVRPACKSVGRAAAATYTLETTTRVTDQVSRIWGYVTDAAVADGAEVDITVPDLSSVPGFQASWGPTNTTDTAVDFIINETATTLSDGKVQAFAVRKDTLGK